MDADSGNNEFVDNYCQTDFEELYFESDDVNGRYYSVGQNIKASDTFHTNSNSNGSKNTKFSINKSALFSEFNTSKDSETILTEKRYNEESDNQYSVNGNLKYENQFNAECITTLDSIKNSMPINNGDQKKLESIEICFTMSNINVFLVRNV